MWTGSRLFSGVRIRVSRAWGWGRLPRVKESPWQPDRRQSRCLFEALFTCSIKQIHANKKHGDGQDLPHREVICIKAQENVWFARELSQESKKGITNHE